MRYDHYQLGKMISSPEEFAIAVKAPKESFGTAARSTAAPNRIEELLSKIREAEAEGRPSADLRYQLRTTINTIRLEAMARRQANRRMPLPYQPRSIVITVRRGRPGMEHAQVMVDDKPIDSRRAAKSTSHPISIRVTPINQRAKQARIAELMRQIRQAEARGQPTDLLRRQLGEMVDSLNR